MNNTQIQAILAPIIGIAVAWLASKFPLLDQATWSTLVNSVVFAVVAAFMAIITKKSSLANSVAPAGGNTVIVTDKATADALPANNNVVSNTDSKVVNK